MINKFNALLLAGVVGLCAGTGAAQAMTPCFQERYDETLGYHLMAEKRVFPYLFSVEMRTKPTVSPVNGARPAYLEEVEFIASDGVLDYRSLDVAWYFTLQDPPFPMEELKVSVQGEYDGHKFASEEPVPIETAPLTEEGKFMAAFGAFDGEAAYLLQRQSASLTFGFPDGSTVNLETENIRDAHYAARNMVPEVQRAAADGACEPASQ